MKKSIVSLLLLASCFAGVSAQDTCVDILTTLSRGNESGNVRILQGFLISKGFLKTTANGYFGPATFTAVKAYQKSVGLSQVGAVGPATRAAIKKESCTTKATSPAQNQTVSTSTSQTKTSTSSQPFIARPTLTSLDTGTLFVNASTTWSLVVLGASLSTSTNKVYMKNIANNKKYTIGIVPSDGGIKVALPQSLTKGTYSCGSSCEEMLPAGDYDISIETEGGESNTLRTKINTFSISSSSGSPYTSIKQMATGTLLGVVSFSASVPYELSDLSAQTVSDGLQGGAGLTNVVTKDEVTKEVLTTFGSSSSSLSAYQSKIVGVYGDIESFTSGYIHGTLTVTINDFIGKKQSTFISAPFSVSVSGI